MPITNRIADYHDDMTAWRRDIHQHPELALEEHRTSAFIQEKLKAFGVDEVVAGFARTGLVGVIHGRDPGGAIGLRADIDALPILEATGLPYASTIPGVMHACGLASIGLPPSTASRWGRNRPITGLRCFLRPSRGPSLCAGAPARRCTTKCS